MSNLSLQQFTASARKHTKYISQPSSSQNLAAKPCKQKKKKLYRIVDRQSSKLTLQQQAFANS